MRRSKRRGRTGWMRVLLAGLLMLVASAGVGCQTSPVTGNTQLNMLGTEEEIELGAEAAPQFLEGYGGPIPDQQVVSYVQTIGMGMARKSERPDLPWEVFAVDSAVVNAFALPGGKVFVTRGLLAELDNEAQLAGVLGHEIAHVTHQHIGQQMTQQLLIQLGIAAIMTAGAVTEEEWLQAVGVGAGVGGALYTLSFSRSHETQSDSTGLRYMTEAGYNPYGLMQVMEIFQKLGARGQPEFLSTHPYPETRIENLREIIDKEYPDAGDQDAYKWGKEAYQRNVLDRLKKLPAPKHTGKEQQQGG